ncbi:hypothetical protein MUG78_17305 [Gordonia alkaliphila]|uniref:hypothetical protein n=1 Tax=Gordonia alkaliphila TaxID=1053547 RepID=UPI001FF33B7A|nr:hypothetical protein [Gordonia alkaliphila]MCK0441159.1 hypothetical protein [Gordonia alkaliphila]
MFYAENGKRLAFYPDQERSEALTKAARDFGSDHEIRMYRAKDLIPFIYHTTGDYILAMTPIEHGYLLLHNALDVQWWGPDDPGLTLFTPEMEMVSIVFGDEARGGAVLDDFQLNMSQTNYFS